MNLSTFAHLLAVACVAMGCAASFMAADEGARYRRTSRILSGQRADAARLAVGNAAAAVLMFGAAAALVTL